MGHREETNEEVKVVTISALGAWLAHTDGLPKQTMTRLADGLKEKDVLRRAHLKALVTVRQAVATCVYNDNNNSYTFPVWRPGVHLDHHQIDLPPALQ